MNISAKYFWSLARRKGIKEGKLWIILVNFEAG